MDKKKEILLEVLQKRHGIISDACKAVNVSRPTFYKWKREDKEFSDAVDEINEQVVDLAENALIKKIKEGDVTSIIFFLKTKGRNRGYQEKTEIDINSLQLPQIELQESNFEEVETILLNEAK